jgi:hypothetical protein
MTISQIRSVGSLKTALYEALSIYVQRKAGFLFESTQARGPFWASY